MLNQNFNIIPYKKKNLNSILFTLLFLIGHDLNCRQQDVPYCVQSGKLQENMFKDYKNSEV